MCVNCERAENDWRHQHQTRGCPDCLVRFLARSKQHIRDAAFDHIEKNIGVAALMSIKTKIRAEDQRIELLRGDKC